MPHEKFHYKSLEEVKQRAAELGVSLPFALDTHCLAYPLQVRNITFPNRRFAGFFHHPLFFDSIQILSSHRKVRKGSPQTPCNLFLDAACHRRFRHSPRIFIFVKMTICKPII